MAFFSSRRTCRAVLPLLGLGMLFFFSGPTVFAANIGTVVPVVGQVTDVVYDEPRNLVYLANPPRNEVEIYSVDGGQLVGSFFTGLQPASLALSPDGNTLYAANIGSLTISAIDLNFQQRVAEYFVGSRPDSIAVGSDGKVVILGTAGLLRLDPVTGVLFPVPISPPPTPPAGLPPIPASPTPAGFLAGLVATASGNLMIGLSTNRLFVYEVASGTVLRSRNVTGLRALLSASTDGSRFMAGPFLFDTQTLTILGRAGTVSATLTGGSAFSVDGNAVYATFSTQPPINPLNTNNPQHPGGAVIPGAIAGRTSGRPTQAVLQILRSSSLAPELGLRLPEAITSKIISSSDGQNLFASSTSGLLVIPVGRLSNLPVLDVSATNVVLSVDMCNRTVATASVQVRNVGGGRMTFAAAVNNQNAPVILNQRSGVASSTLNISFDPRRVTTRGTQQYAVVLVAPEAVNIEPAILVNLNFRDVGDRGTIVPMTGVGVDLQMDPARQRLYIANYTQDQIEVFSLESQTFLPPIRVGNRPRSLAMVDPFTLVVANSGAENLSVVDLDTMQETDQIPMAPVPLNATPLFPRAVAASSNAVLFSAVPLPAASGVAPGNGSVWQLSLLTHSAFPRLNLGTGTTNVIQGRNLLLAPADGSAIVVVEGNGNLRLYDPIADTFAVTRAGAVTGLRGTASAAADGSFYVVDNFVFNSVLALQGAIAPSTAGPPGRPGGGPGGAQAQAALAFGVIAAGNNAVRVQAATTQTPVQSLQRYNLSTLQPELQVFLPEQVIDISPAQIGTVTGTRQWPPRTTALELGVNNQTQLLPRGMAMDSSNNAYLLTFSGLSIVSLRAAAGRTPSFQASGVVNSASGTRPVSPGTLITIFGSNLADSAEASTTPWPRTLGGVCVTANEVAIPLLSTSPTQIDAQLPPDLGTGRVTLTVRSTRLGQVSAGVQVQVSATSPGVFSMDVNGQQRALLFHAADLMLVTPDYPADRDESLILYATGLGPVSPAVPAGQAASADPVSTTNQRVEVAIGGHPYVVIGSGLAPGFVGVYQIHIYVPGSRVQGDDLPVVVTAGGMSSATNDAPLAAIH
ncbi:MAG: hypothetical protein HYX74_07760 [Acidobacteria bacterium]|nr:hypothetical protein [Acidobacteriota bacterium]